MADMIQPSAPCHPVRIGMVNFINTAPFYDVWKRTVSRPEWRVTEAAPTELNKLLHQGNLELGLVSSQEYAAHPESYRILADLSISATGPVGSVFFFSDNPLESLADSLLLLTSQSQTSVCLLKIILEEFYAVTPRYISGSVKSYRSNDHGGVLAIGDDALKMRHAGNFAYSFDLAEIWHKHTGLPFVFAVWAVREEFCQSDSASLAVIHRELLRCVKQGRAELEDISRRVAPTLDMTPAACLAYFKGLEYDLGDDKRAALNLFFQYLVNRGEASPQSLPLKICDSL